MRSSRKSPVAKRGATPTPVSLDARTRAQPSPGGESLNERQQSLDLPAGGDTARFADAQVARRARQLWLGIHFPRLSLESLYRDTVSGAHAVFEEQQSIRRILAVDEAGAAAGVCPGISVNAALALSPDLCLEERSRDREAQLMNDLAAWAGRFTSFVVLEPRGILLLEVAGSARLFAGLRTIRRLVLQDLDARGLTASVAIAPTPLASTWLAQSNEAVCVEDAAHLVGHLSRLPLSLLAWPEKVTAALAGVGASSVGDCLRLPRSGFARRFGTFYLQQLDRALGRLPDPRTHHRTPELFCADQELDEEQTDRDLLLAVCRQLLCRFERFLRVRQLRVQRVQFSFFHLRETATRLVLGRMQAGQSIDHWFDLLRIKFERVELPAAVIAVRLRGGLGQSSSLATESLRFAGSAAARDASVVYLLERFRARLGTTSVHGVDVVAEHRPQYAWCPVPLLEDVPRCARPEVLPAGLDVEDTDGVQRTQRLLLRRPLWMLGIPEKLETRKGQPLYRGELLELISPPERVETGWWDEQGVARDYFVARAAAGAELWVFRDRRQDREAAAWYLHGLFA